MIKDRIGEKKYKKDYFSGRDILLIAMLVMINIAIIGYGVIRDRSYAKELVSLAEASTNRTKLSMEENSKEELKVAEDNKILNKEIKNKEVVFPRNSYIESSLNGSNFKGLILGDSIAQGIGASSGNFLEQELGNRIFTSINKLTKEAMVADNYSVGGSTVETMVSYIADNPQGKSKAYEYPYWILITGRNDIEALTVEQFKYLYSTVVAQGEKNGIDVICVTEPPQVNVNTGELIEDKYSQYRTVIEEVAKEQGATFVDVYNGMLKKKSAGENISKLSSNGILPNNEGYKYIAELITEGIVGKNIEFNKLENKSELKLIAQYDVKGTVAKTKPQNLTTKGTAKEFNTGSREVMTLESGEEVSIQVPDGQVTGVVLTFISSGNTGNVQVKNKAGELNTTLKTNSSQSREVSYFLSLENIKDIKEIILSPKGDIYISGLTFLMK